MNTVIDLTERRSEIRAHEELRMARRLPPNVIDLDHARATREAAMRRHPAGRALRLASPANDH